MHFENNFFVSIYTEMKNVEKKSPRRYYEYTYACSNNLTCKILFSLVRIKIVENEPFLRGRI